MSLCTTAMQKCTTVCRAQGVRAKKSPPASHTAHNGCFHPLLMADDRQAMGRRGEALAAAYLERHGWRILARNHRTREGEIDLIATRRGTLAFCEVKTLVRRRAPPVRGPSDPLECIAPAKRSRVRRLARAWLAHSAAQSGVRRHAVIQLDVIAVLLAADGTLLRLDHLPSAF